MTSDLVPAGDHSLARAGTIANQIAGRAAWSDYQERLAKRTLARQAGDLALFADYLRSLGLPAGDLNGDPQAWQGISWGLVAGFVRWQLSNGYAVASINVRLSTVKTYARLAMHAGVLDASEYAQILAVKGYRKAEGKHIDEQRAMAGLETRRAERRGALTLAGLPSRNHKKAQPIGISLEQADQLKTQPDTPQGRRDKLLLCLLLDHGLRVGEVALLAVSDFDLRSGKLVFYRPKVDKVQTHKLTLDTLEAARSYLNQDAPALGSIWRGSRKGKGGLQASGMSARAITERVRLLGAALEGELRIDGLSAHDCRHYWATRAARKGTQIDRLQDAGGWSSPAMPLRYVEAARVANEGVKL
jgi:integrase